MKTLFVISILLAHINILSAQPPKLMLPVGHSNRIISLCYSPDNRRFVTSSSDSTVKIWDAFSGMLLADLIGHSSIVYKINYSVDGKRIVTASLDGSAKIWDANTASLLFELKGICGIFSATFSPDSRKIITANCNGTASIWDLETRKIILELKGHQGILWDVDFSPDGKKIVTASEDKTSKIWDATSADLLFDLKAHTDKVFVSRFSHDGRKIITGSEDGTAKIWDATNGSLILNLKGQVGILKSAIFSSDDKKILSVSRNGVCALWECSNGNNITTISENVSAGCFSTDGKRIVLAYESNKLAVLDANTLVPLIEQKQHTSNFTFISYLPGGKEILTKSENSQYKIWDSQSGRFLNNLNLNYYFEKNNRFSPNGKQMLFPGNWENTVKVFDVNSWKVVCNLKGHSQVVDYAEFSSDGKKIITTSRDNTAKIWDAESGTLLADLKGHKSRVISGKFSPDCKSVLTISKDNTAILWDAITGIFIAVVKGPTGRLNSICFSPDGRKIAISYNYSTKICNAVNGDLIIDLKDNFGCVYSLFFSDSKYILTSTVIGYGKVWDTETGKIIEKLQGFTTDNYKAFLYDNGRKIILVKPGNYFVDVLNVNDGRFMNKLKDIAISDNYLSFSTDNKRVITAYRDNIASVWDFKRGISLYNFLPLDSIDYFIQLPSGFYECSRNSSKLLYYVTKDLKVITFEQLDIKYNRPDKVLEVINGADTPLIKAYKKAYEKRIKILGIDTTAFRDGYSVPEADFANRESIEREQKQKDLVLHIVGTDSVYKLDRYNIWVNEVPVYGQRGSSILNRNSNNLDARVTIHLSEGENKIETSIINVNGTESYRMPLTVNYNPLPRQKPTIHFVGIGIDKFGNNKYNLQYSTKDIRDLSFKLKEKFGKDIIIDTLFNEEVSVDKVKALKKNLLQTTENDKVIIAYSGHGVLSKDFDYYLSTYSMNFENPQKGGLSYDDLENLVDSIPARNKLMLIDACHSGELDKEDLVALNNISDSLRKGIKPVAYKNKEKHLGLKNSFELMQSLFLNVSKGTGATIISAASGTQSAWENGKLKNGVFTFSILEAMDKYPTLKISELKKIVGERVEELTKGLQKPTSRNETIALDWDVW